MKTSAYLILPVLFFALYGCESPHEKSSRRHLANIALSLEKIAIDYDQFRDSETELKLGKLNLYFNETLRKVSLLKTELSAVYPSQKFKNVTSATDSLLSLSKFYFEMRKEKILVLEDLRSTIELYNQSKKDFQEHTEALKTTTATWVGHHKTMAEFEQKKMLQREEKVKILLADLAKYSETINQYHQFFESQERIFNSENIALQILDNELKIVEILYEKENKTSQEVENYLKTTADELFNS